MTMRLGVLLAMIALLCSCSRTVSMQAAIQRWNTTCLLVFGDSTVDPGNNNRLPAGIKANFPPYGMDFLGHRPTGRFCDGRLVTDFISEALGVSTILPAFLDPTLKPEQLTRGVSFASASSGYDVLTATQAGVFSIPQQIEYLMHYKIHLRKYVGPMKAEQVIKNALVVVSAGVNDFIANYYLYPDRPKQFTEQEYEDYLISLMSKYIQEIHRLGSTKFVVANIPPIGCLPFVRTLSNSDHCVKKLNDVAMSFNTKLVAKLSTLKKTLGLRAAYLDVYRIMYEVIENPMKYGFVETSKGCCGSGMIETGDSCKGQITCKNPTKYMFWDAVHPTERLYQIIADVAMKSVVPEVMG